MKSRIETLRENVNWGIRWGMYFATGFTIVAAIVGSVRLFVGPGAIELRILELAGTIAVYYSGGLAGGAVVGVLRGFLNSCIGAVIVGIIATIPASFAAGMLVFGLYDWPGHAVPLLLWIAAVWGGVMSLVLWFSRDL